MTATSKYLDLSEWVADQEATDAGPVEAKAFLDGLLAKVGVATLEDVKPGPLHQGAGE